MRIRDNVSYTTDGKENPIELFPSQIEICRIIAGENKTFKLVRKAIEKESTTCTKDEHEFHYYLGNSDYWIPNKDGIGNISMSIYKVPNTTLDEMTTSTAIFFLKESMIFQRGILEVFSSLYHFNMMDEICGIPQLSLITKFGLKDTLIELQYEENKDLFKRGIDSRQITIDSVKRLFDVEYLYNWLEKRFLKKTGGRLMKIPYTDIKKLPYKKEINHALSTMDKVVKKNYEYYITLQSDFPQLFYNNLNNINLSNPYLLGILGLKSYDEVYDNINGIGNNSKGIDEGLYEFYDMLNDMRDDFRLYRMGIVIGRAFIRDNVFIKNTIMDTMHIASLQNDLDEASMEEYIKQLVPLRVQSQISNNIYSRYAQIALQEMLFEKNYHLS